MAGNMGGEHSEGRKNEEGPLWRELSAEARAEYINRDVEQIIVESRAATREIVDAAIKEFAEDYAEIKSWPMRKSVLRNVAEVPYPVDAELPNAVDEPRPQEVRPLSSRRGTIHSFFLQLFGL
jgi:hypothetical protein